MYVKLFGGPYDGRMENVIDGCNSLRLKPPTEEPGSEPSYVVYRRSKEDPGRFVYEGVEE